MANILYNFAWFMGGVFSCFIVLFIIGICKLRKGETLSENLRDSIS